MNKPRRFLLSLSTSLSGSFSRFRSRLADAGDSRTLLTLSIWSSVVGVVAGIVMVAMNFALEYIPMLMNIESTAIGDSFESMPPLWRLLLPLAGGFLLGAVFHFLGQYGALGIPHVLASLATRDGQMAWRNAVVQFFAGIFALLSGQSMGKEGPAVHIGAACGSDLSKRAGLPNTSTRVLVASGAAAAIAAAFDTPLAGVVFAMEVILMEYTIAGFAPIILATVSATTVTRIAASLFGAEYAVGVELVVPTDLFMKSLAELPWLLVCGLVIGIIAAAFVRSIRRLTRLARRIPIWLLFTTAGLVTGSIGYFVPEVLGIGYDSLTVLLESEATPDVELSPVLLGLFGLLAAKFVATAVSVGAGMPAGLIGPSLLLGAVAGCIMGWLGQFMFPDMASTPGYYALVGMGAMMAAVLQAPLAALLALLELTANPDVILPGMLVSVTAYLTCRVAFNQPPVFRMLLRSRGLSYRTDPITQGLRHSTVMDAMDRSVRQIDGEASTLTVEQLRELELTWLLFTVKENDTRLLPLQKVFEQTDPNQDVAKQDEAEVEFTSAPVQLGSFTSSTLIAKEIDWRMTLVVARNLFESGAEALFVTTQHRRLGRQVLGILTPEILQNYIRTSLR